jgi:FAD/FMN-containing dehydrogenase
LDLSSGIVEVQAGARIGEMVLELSKHGLAVPAGTCQNTAVGGLTLGGGVGFLNRKYGLTLDNLLAVHIILEDGSHVEATKEGNYADLFWACQGAGNGNFGVVTSFVFKARKIKVVTLFELWFDYSHMIELLEKWQVWSVEVSKDITSEIDIVNDPNNPGPILLTGQSESGDLRSALEIFFHLKPVQARIWETSYADSVRHHGTPLDKTNWFFYQNTAFLPKALLHSALEILLENLQNAPNGHKLELLALGGKISKVPSTATAFPWRASQHWLHLQAAWRDPLQAHNMTRYSEKLFQELYPFLVDPNIGTIQAYVNFPSLELGSSYPRAYWGENYPRLQRIKAKYDPCNFFRTPQPIVGCHMT